MIAEGKDVDPIRRAFAANAVDAEKARWDFSTRVGIGPRRYATEPALAKEAGLEMSFTQMVGQDRVTRRVKSRARGLETISEIVAANVAERVGATVIRASSAVPAMRPVRGFGSRSKVSGERDVQDVWVSLSTSEARASISSCSNVT